jgi:hypothetical protein
MNWHTRKNNRWITGKRRGDQNLSFDFLLVGQRSLQSLLRPSETVSCFWCVSIPVEATHCAASKHGSVLTTSSLCEPLAMDAHHKTARLLELSRFEYEESLATAVKWSEMIELLGPINIMFHDLSTRVYQQHQSRGLWLAAAGGREFPVVTAGG